MHGKIYFKWKRLLADFWTSHLTLAEYCRRHNLNPKIAGRWKIVFQKEGSHRIDSPAELEIVPVNHQDAGFMYAVVFSKLIRLVMQQRVRSLL